MRLNRRVFLRRSGMLLAALGLSEAGLSWLTERYQQALAQPTRRKLALLIGINQYPEQVCDFPLTRGLALNGCLTDVELQRELLIYRFGFQPQDILTLTDQQATRQNIEEAFLFHLTNQAQAGDVVVFHFSGLGSRVHWEGQPEPQNSLVTVDGFLPTVESPVINDLPEETLGLLLRSLSTEQVTTILDTAYTDLGKVFQGNLRIRSRPNAPTGQPNDRELAFQQQWMEQLQVSQEQIRTQWRSGQLPGIVLAATKPGQVATEGQWNGFNAGLFTYALTQQLWGATSTTTLRTTLCLATGTVKQFTGAEQQPASMGQKLQIARLPAYNLLPEAVDADGVIQAVEEDGKVQLWLAGLPTPVLENYGASILTIVPAADLPSGGQGLATAREEPTTESTTGAEASAEQSRTPPFLQIRSRDGLSFKARPGKGDSAYELHAGQLVQEAVRILPRNVGLTIALDTSLERIERVDATSAFSAIPRVTSVIAGEPADFLFGKMEPGTDTLTASLAATPVPPPLNRGYGLFSLGRGAIPSTLIQEDEAVKTAIHRIAPQLQTLLALKLLRLTANRGSSRLGVRATLEMTAPQERIVMQQETARTQVAAETKPRVYTADLFTGDGAVMLPVGSRVRYQLQNTSRQPIYFILAGLDPTGSPIVFYSTAEKAVIPPDETLVIPQAMAEWIVQGPCNLAEIHLIFSRSPFTQAYQTLKVASKTDVRQITQLQNPLDVAQAILQDLHDASPEISPKFDLPADTYVLDVNAWASLEFVYQVIET